MSFLLLALQDECEVCKAWVSDRWTGLEADSLAPKGKGINLFGSYFHYARLLINYRQYAVCGSRIVSSIRLLSNFHAWKAGPFD